MRFIFICLLIANVVLFTLWRGYLSNPVAETHQPQRLLQQQNSKHLTLISAEMAASPVVVTQTGESVSCLEWGAFQLSELTNVEEKLNSLSFGQRQSRQSAQEIASTIVYIPPLGSKSAAENKAAELTSLGVTDFFIIQDQSSNLRWGISLGVFKSEEAAKQLLAKLISNGVRGAQLGTRTVASNKFNFVFKDVSGSEKASLDKLKAEFPAQDLRECK